MRKCQSLKPLFLLFQRMQVASIWIEKGSWAQFLLQWTSIVIVIAHEALLCWKSMQKSWRRMALWKSPYLFHLCGAVMRKSGQSEARYGAAFSESPVVKTQLFHCRMWLIPGRSLGKELGSFMVHGGLPCGSRNRIPGAFWVPLAHHLGPRCRCFHFHSAQVSQGYGD